MPTASRLRRLGDNDETAVDVLEPLPDKGSSVSGRSTCSSSSHAGGRFLYGERHRRGARMGQLLAVVILGLNSTRGRSVPEMARRWG